MDHAAETAFRRELEAAGEESVRADFYGGGGLATGGEDRRQVIRMWLRDKERERENQGDKANWYARWTFWAAVGALVVSTIGVIATVLHK